MKPKKKISRREFLKLSALAFGGLMMKDRARVWMSGERRLYLQEEPPPDFPEGLMLGRICAGQEGAHFDIKSEPYWDAPSVGTAWRDDVFEWQQEVIAKQIDPIRINQRWVQTPEGYIYAEYVQKTRHITHTPLSTLPEMPDGSRGMWVEITTPYTDLVFEKPPAQHWIREAIRPRIYYSQIFWAFDIREDPATGKLQYCLKQLYGALPDEYWVDASICRQITPEEVAPIHHDVPDKHMKVDLRYQTMTCFEGDDEVFFAQVTTGGIGEEGKWLTPIGTHTIWRKMISTHMSAGSAVGNYDISGVAWTTLFDNNGAAVHSTFWHNYYGTARSHGCVNSKPEDAKWVWRWTEPAVPYYPGEISVQGMNKSTKVEVVTA